MRRIVRKTLLIIGITLGSLILLLVGSIVFFEHKWGEAIIDRCLEALNDRLQVPVSTSDVNLTFFKNFPHVSVELEDVLIPGAHPNVFGKHDTLLTAKSVFLALNTLDLLRGDYAISQIKIAGGRLALRHSQDGEMNYDILKPTPPDTVAHHHDSFDAVIKINGFALEDMVVIVVDPTSQLDVVGSIESLRAKGSFSSAINDLWVKTEGYLDHFRQNQLTIASGQPFLFEASLLANSDSIVAKEALLELERDKLQLTGSYQINSHTIDAHLSGETVHIKTITDLASQYSANLPVGLELRGTLSTSLRINGSLEAKQKVNIDMSMSSNNIQAYYMGAEYKITDMQSHFSNGAEAAMRTSVLEIQNLNIIHKNSTGVLIGKLSNLDKPNISGSIDLLLRDDEVELPYFASILKHYHSIHCKGQFQAEIGALDSLTLGSIRSPKIGIELNFEDLHLEPNPFQKFTHLNGAVTFIDNDIRKCSVSGKWNDASFDIGIHGQNFMALVNGIGKASLTLNLSVVNWDVPSDFPAAWNPDLAKKKEGKESKASNKKEDPRQVETLKSESKPFHYSQIWQNLSQITGEVYLGDCQYQGSTLDTLKLQFNAKEPLAHAKIDKCKIFGGTLQGNVTFAVKDSASQLLTAELSPSEMDIQTIFRSFNNFGQSYVTANQIRGRVSANIAVNAPFKYFHYDGNEMETRIAVTVQDGELKGVDGLKTLSTFIKLSDLVDVHFSLLQNELYISKRTVHIPKMHIASNAISMDLKGTHRFDNSFEYRIGLSLTSLLFNRLRASNKLVEENSLEEKAKDGGRSLFLVIEGDSVKTHVRYDTETLRERIRDFLQREGQEIRERAREKDAGKHATSTQDHKDEDGFSMEWDDSSNGTD